MKWFSYVIAAIVSAVVYMVIMERDAVMHFAGVDSATASQPAPEPAAAPAKAERAEHRVSVVAMKSSAQVIDSAVILRGRTEALQHAGARVLAVAQGLERLQRERLRDAREALLRVEVQVVDLLPGGLAAVDQALAAGPA